MARTISKLAKELNINIETVRFYEKKGLIAQPPKPEVGYRHYPDSTVERLRFIRKAQALGFTLNEILGLLNLNDSPCQQVQSLAQSKLADVNEKITALLNLQQALTELVEQCSTNDSDKNCPLINALQG